MQKTKTKPKPKKTTTQIKKSESKIRQITKTTIVWKSTLAQNVTNFAEHVAVDVVVVVRWWWWWWWWWASSTRRPHQLASHCPAIDERMYWIHSQKKSIFQKKTIDVMKTKKNQKRKNHTKKKGLQKSAQVVLFLRIFPKKSAQIVLFLRILPVATTIFGCCRNCPFLVENRSISPFPLHPLTLRLNLGLVWCRTSPQNFIFLKPLVSEVFKANVPRS